MSQSDLIAEIIERAKLSNIPAISLLEQIPGLYHSGIDNYEAITRIVEHLIAEHGCRTLNFIGGPEFNREISSASKLTGMPFFAMGFLSRSSA